MGHLAGLGWLSMRLVLFCLFSIAFHQTGSHPGSSYGRGTYKSPSMRRTDLRPLQLYDFTKRRCFSRRPASDICCASVHPLVQHRRHHSTRVCFLALSLGLSATIWRLSLIKTFLSKLRRLVFRRLPMHTPRNDIANQARTLRAIGFASGRLNAGRHVWALVVLFIRTIESLQYCSVRHG
ncbi:hypothetical protein OH77DRAFT_957466 [Trametes cingulata]|nr:hypothetical protein OH77DRAFT_957466 [Trametes cingulata]